MRWIAWQRGEAGSLGWVFSKYICATCQKPGAFHPALPFRPWCASLAIWGVSRNHEAAHSSALRLSSSDKGHVLSGALFPA